MEGHRCCPLHAVQGFFTQLALDLGKISSGNVGHSKGSALMLLVVCLGCGCGDHDDPSWARHLDLQAPIVWDSHELCVTWLSQQSMVRTSEINHLEIKSLLPEVGGILNMMGSQMLPRGVAWTLRMIPKKGAPLGQWSFLDIPM